jgi:multiple sugar transport system ATP-binding protein
VEQIGSPMDLYNNPGNLFVAGFLGSPSMNFLDPKMLGIDNAKTVGIRPEHITLSDSGKLQGEISHIEQLGGDTNVYVRLTGSELVTVRLFGQHQHSVGSKTALTFDDENLYLFDQDDQRIR